MTNFFSRVRNNSSYPHTFFVLCFLSLILITQSAVGQFGPGVNSQVQPKKLQDFNFVVAGDFGCGDNAKKTIANMMNKKPGIWN